jgi:hypothetical protein
MSELFAKVRQIGDKPKAPEESGKG